MTSTQQVEANRRNARLSTGPVTEEGKKRSRRNALRHGLTAETIIDALEDAKDYVAFEMAIKADHDPQNGSRARVLRLASLLWRLHRATAVESGLFKIEARQLLQLRLTGEAHQSHLTIIDSMDRNALSNGHGTELDRQDTSSGTDIDATPSPVHEQADEFDDLTHSFTRLASLPTYPLGHLNRYGAALWRQAARSFLRSGARIGAGHGNR
jgi:hypothetical protein